MVWSDIFKRCGTALSSSILSLERIKCDTKTDSWRFAFKQTCNTQILKKSIFIDSWQFFFILCQYCNYWFNKIYLPGDLKIIALPAPSYYPQQQIITEKLMHYPQVGVCQGVRVRSHASQWKAWTLKVPFFITMSGWKLAKFKKHLKTHPRLRNLFYIMA